MNSIDLRDPNGRERRDVFQPKRVGQCQNALGRGAAPWTRMNVSRALAGCGPRVRRRRPAWGLLPRCTTCPPYIEDAVTLMPQRETDGDARRVAL
jgi:hypothetical protein